MDDDQLVGFVAGGIHWHLLVSMWWCPQARSMSAFEKKPHKPHAAVSFTPCWLTSYSYGVVMGSELGVHATSLASGVLPGIELC